MPPRNVLSSTNIPPLLFLEFVFLFKAAVSSVDDPVDDKSQQQSARGEGTVRICQGFPGLDTDRYGRIAGQAVLRGISGQDVQVPQPVELGPVSYTHLRAHETRHDLVCRLLLEKKKKKTT